MQSFDLDDDEFDYPDIDIENWMTPDPEIFDLSFPSSFEIHSTELVFVIANTALGLSLLDIESWASEFQSSAVPISDTSSLQSAQASPRPSSRHANTSSPRASQSLASTSPRTSPRASQSPLSTRTQHEQVLQSVAKEDNHSSDFKNQVKVDLKKISEPTAVKLC
jgi:hypothetical protein